MLGIVRNISEYKGKQDLYQRQSPQVMETLRQVALIQSTESSNRIEGVTAPAHRIRSLMERKTTPRNRSEQEIAGYRDVLSTIHASAADIPFTTDTVLRLHRDLYQFIPGEGGHWKRANNQIVEIGPDMKKVRFQPVAAHLTADAMDLLHERFKDRWDAGELDRLVLTAAYVLDFLCIHPFHDGNGRMARLITTLLLYHAGYEVGRYVSLEQIVERTKESYYDTLRVSSMTGMTAPTTWVLGSSICSAW